MDSSHANSVAKSDHSDASVINGGGASGLLGLSPALVTIFDIPPCPSVMLSLNLASQFGNNWPLQ